MKTIKEYFFQLDQKWLVLLTSLLLLISPILYINSLHNPSHVPRMALLSLIASVAVLYLLIQLLNKDCKYHFHKIHFLIFILLTWATISIIWTVDYGNFTYEIITLWGLVGIFFVASHIASYRNINLLVMTSIIGAGFASIIALLQNYDLNPSYIIFNSSIMHSTFAYKNHFALYLDLIIPLTLAIVVISENNKLRWILVIFSGLISGTLLELHTRGSWLSLFFWIVMAIFLIFLIRKKSPETLSLIVRRKYELLTILAISIAIFMSHGKVDETWKRSATQGEVLDTSSKDRLLIYYNSLQMIKDKPITGFGYGAFWKGFREYSNNPYIIQRTNPDLVVYRLHNDPLQYFTEIGIPGGILILTIFFFIIYMGIKQYLIYTEPKHKILILALILSVVACGIHSLIDFPLHKPSSAIQFWLSLGLISGLYIKHHFKPILVKTSLIVFFILTILSYSSIAIIFHTKNIKSNYFLRQAMVTDKCDEATDYIDKSVEVGGFYLISHIMRVSTHISCNTPVPEMLDIIQEELAWDPTNVRALLYRGQILLNYNRPTLALDDYKKVNIILPHYSPAKVGMIYSLLKLNRKDEAMTLLEKTIKEHPEQKDAKKLMEEISQ